MKTKRVDKKYAVWANDMDETINERTTPNAIGKVNRKQKVGSTKKAQKNKRRKSTTNCRAVTAQPGFVATPARRVLYSTRSAVIKVA
jgi:hypothetical protein